MDNFSQLTLNNLFLPRYDHHEFHRKAFAIPTWQLTANPNSDSLPLSAESAVSDPFYDFMLGRESQRLRDIDHRYFWVFFWLVVPFTILGFFYL
jgi:hypothetical protein